MDSLTEQIFKPRAKKQRKVKIIDFEDRIRRHNMYNRSSKEKGTGGGEAIILKRRKFLSQKRLSSEFSSVAS